MIRVWCRRRSERAQAEHRDRVRQLELAAGVGTHDWLSLTVPARAVKFYDPQPGDGAYALCPSCPTQAIGWVGGVLANAIAMQCPACERWFRNPKYPLALVSLDGETVLAEDGGPVTKIQRMRAVFPGEIIDLGMRDSDQAKADQAYNDLMIEALERHRGRQAMNCGQLYAPRGAVLGAPGQVIEYDPKKGPPEPFQGVF